MLQSDRCGKEMAQARIPVSLPQLYGSQRFRVIPVTYMTDGSSSPSIQRPHNVQSFSATLLPPLTSWSPFSPPLVLSCPSSSPIQFSLSHFDPRCYSLSTPSPVSHTGSDFRVYYDSMSAWKSITSSQHCLNFQLTRLRSISSDPSVASDQPLEHQIRHWLTQEETLALAQHTPCDHSISTTNTAKKKMHLLIFYTNSRSTLHVMLEWFLIVKSCHGLFPTQQFPSAHCELVLKPTTLLQSDFIFQLKKLW